MRARLGDAGVALLRKLTPTSEDRDTIHAVVLATEPNQDDSNNGCITQPVVGAYEQLIEIAFTGEKVNIPRQGFSKPHGTGTVLDSIQHPAIGETLRPFRSDQGPLIIVSIAELVEVNSRLGMERPYIHDVIL